MPRKLELTWDKARGRWKKFYRGKQYYFPYGTGKTDMAGYQTALDAWQKLLTELGGPPPAPRVVPLADRTKEGMADWYVRNGRAKDAARIRQTDGNPLEGISEAGKAVWQDRLEQIARPQGTTVSDVITLFLGAYKKEQLAGLIEASSYNLMVFKTTQFKNFAGSVAIKDIDHKILESFRDHLLDQIGEKKLSQTYASDLMKNAIRLVKWSYKKELIEQLPKSLLEAGAYSIQVDEQEIRTFTIPEITTILSHLSERFQLYFLLMLNCGFTQKDVAFLTFEQVDFANGTIRRKRTKTHKKKRVPKVCFKLWPRTLELLNKYKAAKKKGQPFVLLNANGRQLVRGETDNIKKTFGRIMAAKKIKATPKMFRATSSTMLDEHPRYGRYARYFLGHAPRTTGDKHYITPSQRNFDRALRWLGRKYGLVERKHLVEVGQ